MSRYFEELDYCPTPMGALSLRRRYEPKVGIDVFEIKLGDTFLMSSLFTASEIALTEFGLAELSHSDLDVVVGGLGLGYTALAAVQHPRVRSVLVVEALGPVIDWHKSGLLPLGATLTGNPRCRLLQADFFQLAARPEGFDADQLFRRHDAILVDIDHSPNSFLDSRNAVFYSIEGLSAFAMHLKPGGVFGLWSNDAPDECFTRRLEAVFSTARAETVTFYNPLQEREHAQTVYLGRRHPEKPGR